MSFDSKNGMALKHMYRIHKDSILVLSGIRLLVDHGRFSAETSGCEDMDEVLSHVQAKMRDTCSKHGLLSSTNVTFVPQKKESKF